MLPSQANLLIPVSKIYNKLNSSRLLIVSMLDYKPKQLKVAKYVRVEARGINSYNNSFEYLAEDLKKYKRQGYQTILVCNSRTRAKRIVKDLTELEVTASFMEYLDHDIEMGSIVITCGNIHKGFEYPLLRLVVIAENDIFTSKNRKKQRKKKQKILRIPPTLKKTALKSLNFVVLLKIKEKKKNSSRHSDRKTISKSFGKILTTSSPES